MQTVFPPAYFRLSVFIVVFVSFGIMRLGATDVAFSNIGEYEALLTTVPGKGELKWSDAVGPDSKPGVLEVAVPGSSHKMLYTVEQYEPDNGKIEASFCFRAGNFGEAGNLTRVALGISPDQQNLATNIRVQARLIKDKSSGDTTKFEVRGAMRGTQSSTEVALEAGHWYKMAVAFERVSNKDLFSVTAKLSDCSSSQIVATISGIRKDSEQALFQNDVALPVHIGIVAQSDSDAVPALDQVTFSQSLD